MTGPVGEAGEAGERTPELRRALFRVVRGQPDDAELAALTAVLAVVSAGEEPAETGPRSVWVDRRAMLRRPLRPGPDAWRMSTWPR